MPGSADSGGERHVLPMYWLTVCRGSAASDAFLFQAIPISELLQIYPILLLPEFPDAIVGIAEVASDDSTLGELCGRKAEVLRKVQSMARERSPRAYAAQMSKLGIELANEGQPDGNRENRLINIRRAIECFRDVRRLPESEVDSSVLIFSIVNEANVLAMLAGMRQDSQHNLTQAIGLLDNAVSLSSNGDERIELQRRADEYRRNLQVVRQLEDGGGASAPDPRAQAQSLRASGDLRGALALYDQVVDRSPGDEQAWLDRGDLLFELGALDVAVESYAKVIEINDARPDAWAATARALAAQDKWLESLACADHALKLDRRHEGARQARARARAHLP